MSPATLAAPQESVLPEATAVIYVRVSTKEQAERDGDPEGYSIPAQREACMRKAAALGAGVVAEYVDRGESARSADRPELQAMLKRLAEQPVDYVIVHKVDRLARNRMDDVTITASIRGTGARLVSVTENIDETPSGLLLHGIMSSIAEFYSRNLATEVIKGTQQKVMAGGTPTRAPIGYLNVRKDIDGREVRTVEVDPERAPLIAWAFEAYATGAYSLHRLAKELEARGLTQRKTAKQPTRPLPGNKLHKVLTNRYYLGLVTWRGVEYEGKHPPLVTPDTFDAVQQVMTAHRTSGERSYRRAHYLAGPLRCARCDSKLIYGVARGRRGDEYDYWFCMGRHTHRNGCQLPYLPAARVEDAVDRAWEPEYLHPAQVQALEAGLLDDLGREAEHHATEQTRLTERRNAIRRERLLWAEKAMTGAVPDDIARDKQQALTEALNAVESQLAATAKTHDNLDAGIRQVMSFAHRPGKHYQAADHKTRRELNQAWWQALHLDCDE